MPSVLAPILIMLQPVGDAEPPNPDWNCDEPMVQQEMNWCAAREYAIADEKLNNAWERAAAKAKRRDDWWADSVPAQWDNRPGFFETLLEAQRAWLKFRDAHCRIEGYAARGGSLEPLLVSACKTALTRERTRQLRELVEFDG